MTERDVTICETGPRDGLQMATAVMPTAGKTALIDAIVAAGAPEIDATSFVPPKYLPQFADAADVVAHALGHPGVRIAAVAPNRRGAGRAVEAGVHAVVVPISVSLGHSLANVKKTPDAQVAAFAEMRAEIDAAPDGRRPELIAGLSTVFGCSIDGHVPEREVERLAAACVAAGADVIALADTVGYGDPAQMRRVIPKVRAAIADARPLRLHLHDTMGLGLANTLAALDCGIRTFDAALGGLGGCPHAPGASGNVVTEDLVFMLEQMGLKTGFDLEALIAARAVLATHLPGERLLGQVPAAGVPKVYAAA